MLLHLPSMNSLS